MQRAHIQISAGPDHGKLWDLVESNSAKVGQAGACDIQLADPGVDPMHLMIGFSNHCWFVFSLSEQEFQVNGEPISDTQTLYDDDIIKVGGTAMRFRIGTAKEAAARIIESPQPAGTNGRNGANGKATSAKEGALSPKRGGNETPTASTDEANNVFYEAALKFVAEDAPSGESEARGKGVCPAHHALYDDLCLEDPSVAAVILEEASGFNLTCTLRWGSTIKLPPAGQLVVSGDLHDHRENLQRLVTLAQLDQSPDHHLILQQVIHGDHIEDGCDLSLDTLLRTAALKTRYPGQVHILLSNHELGQVNGDPVLRNGKGVSAGFELTIDRIYSQEAERIRKALRRYVRSLPLAAKTEFGLMCCHSLPSPQDMYEFDASVLNRMTLDDDMRSGGSANALVWGSHFTPDVTNQLCNAWEVEVFVVGYESSSLGHKVIAGNALALTCEHDDGSALRIDLARGYDIKGLEANVIQLSEIALLDTPEPTYLKLPDAIASQILPPVDAIAEFDSSDDQSEKTDPAADSESQKAGSKSDLNIKRIRGTKIYLVKLPPGRLTDNYVITKIQDHLMELINKSRTAQFVLDLHEVTLMSSEMLGVLVSLQKSAKRKKGYIHLARPALEVSRIFEAIKLHKTVKIYASIEKAVKST